MTKQGAAGPEPYLAFVLHQAIISSYHFSGEGATARPIESISLNFKKLDVKYIPYDDQDTPGAPVPVELDVEAVGAE